MDAIFSFKAQEVKNLMLQTVHDSELKWRSYSHWKPIPPSWRKILHDCEISLGLRNVVLFAAKFHSPLVVSKLKKSTIQCFKWCTIQTWNEGVTGIGRRSLQAKGKFCTAAKSPFCCENVVLLLRNFAALLLWNFSWSFPIFTTDILRYFALDIWCLNPQTLLVTHLS